MDSDKEKPSSGQLAGLQNADQCKEAPTNSDGLPRNFMGQRPEQPDMVIGSKKPVYRLLIFKDIGGAYRAKSSSGTDHIKLS